MREVQIWIVRIVIRKFLMEVSSVHIAVRSRMKYSPMQNRKMQWRMIRYRQRGQQRQLKMQRVTRMYQVIRTTVAIRMQQVIRTTAVIRMYQVIRTTAAIRMQQVIRTTAAIRMQQVIRTTVVIRTWPVIRITGRNRKLIMYHIWYFPLFPQYAAVFRSVS